MLEGSAGQDCVQMGDTFVLHTSSSVALRPILIPSELGICLLRLKHSFIQYCRVQVGSFCRECVTGSELCHLALLLWEASRGLFLLLAPVLLR